MKKLTILTTVTVVLGLLILVGPAMAAPSTPHLNWGSEVNLGQCPDGKLVINVTQRAINSIDSGVASWWAYANYNRQIQVRETAPGTFCAVVRYEGDFTTVAGPSPQNTDTIAAGITGTWQGGYRMTITGSLLATPSWPTRGSVGVTDYACTWTDDGDGVFEYGEESCSGAVNWLDQYFTGWSYSYDWWGWVYHGGRNGTWVNSSDGNQGDITD
jgi:hypothetical protein